MDPATQSAQISSSEGFANRQNSATKESKQSDSFLSSSPVSLIQSPQDKRAMLGSDKPCGGVATSLHSSSQPGSFTPDNYGGEAGPPDQRPDSQIKISPVSERIKTLEALAAKRREPDFRSGGGFSQFRDRNHEKSPSEIPKCLIEKTSSTVQKRGGSTDPESPDSPYEVLGELREDNELEGTEEWMKAHLPPLPDLDIVGLIKGTLTSSISTKEEETVIDAPAAFSGVPDAFVDSPVEAPKLNDELSDTQKHPSVDEESEFDLSFLPTAYVWQQQEKPGVQTPNLKSGLPASPASFGSPSPIFPPYGTNSKQNVSDDTPTGTGDQEASEMGSSGESDDTVIEDGVSAPPTVSDAAFSNDCTSTPASAAPNLPADEKETPLRKSERKLIQVPTINVIESEPNYSEEERELELEAEEDEDYEVVKDQAREASKTPELESEDSQNEPFKRRPLEKEFIEGYSPPSSPVYSDAEYSPKHQKPVSLPEAVHQESASLPNQTDPKDLASNFSHAESEKSQTSSNDVSDEPSPFIVTHEEVDFPDNDGEWSDGAQGVLVKPFEMDLVVMEPTTYTQSEGDEKSNTPAKEASMEGASLSKSCFIQDDIYDRQSLDYDYDASPPLDDIDVTGFKNAEESFLSDSSQIQVKPTNASTAKKEVPEDSKHLEDLTLMSDDEALAKTVPQPSLRDHPQDPYSSFQTETLRSISEQAVNKKMITDIVKDNMPSGNSLSGQSIGPEIQQDTIVDDGAPDTTGSPGSIDPDHSAYEPVDSFVVFMKECLKSKPDEEPDAHEGVPKKEFWETGLPPSQFPPTMAMDLEQERLTIRALKELGSSQEEEEKKEVTSSLSEAPYEDQVELNASMKQSSYTSVPNSPCSQSNLMFDSTYSKDVDAIDEWVAEAYHLAEHVLTGILTHVSVKDLIHWRDPKKSGVVFGVSLLVLLSLAAFSVISVVSYLLLALLCVTITFRIYKSVVQAVQKSSEGHPFKALIEKDVSIPPETFRKHVDTSLTYINRALKQMSRLFLVEDLVDSLKLAVFMWLLTYVGAVFNGITILILADILLFAVPPVYEKNKTQIDHYIELARTQVNNTMAKLQEKLPGAVKRSKTE